MVNEVATVSHREMGEIKGWTDRNLLRYADTKRATEWAESRGLEMNLIPKEGPGAVQSPETKLI